MSGWIGVDLDGTLAHYEDFRGVAHIGTPIKPMVKRVKALLRAGCTVKIFTARVSDPITKDLAVATIQAWTKRHLGEKLEVTNVKDYSMYLLIDDRAIGAQENTGMLCKCAHMRQLP